jgi:hypothetical protein
MRAVRAATGRLTPGRSPTGKYIRQLAGLSMVTGA